MRHPPQAAAAGELAEPQAIGRGAFITGWNDCKHAFVWTKTADQIVEKAALRS